MVSPLRWSLTKVLHREKKCAHVHLRFQIRYVSGMPAPLRFAVHNRRLAVADNDSLFDVLSAGGPHGEPSEALCNWSETLSWLHTAQFSGPAVSLNEAKLACPVSLPRQVFAIGLNYRGHAEENNRPIPTEPLVFTKFPSCVVGPTEKLQLVDGFCDYEAELVVVIGEGGRDIAAAQALSRVAGYTVGQDISERERQMRGGTPQFSLAKSHPGFGPVGPFITPLDQLEDPNDLAISCTLNGETMQSSRTSDLIFDVSTIVHELSLICELFPGDLIFTGTPSGVGVARKPPRPLVAGDIIETTIEGLGTLRTECAAPV
jgi:2,4-didehydro-3-deoxy-L-rhamnonate hydrolase